MDHPVIERLMSFLSYSIGGLVTASGWSNQDWYGLVGAVCTVIMVKATIKYKRMNYQLRLREVELKEQEALRIQAAAQGTSGE